MDPSMASMPSAMPLIRPARVSQDAFMVSPSLHSPGPRKLPLPQVSADALQTVAWAAAAIGFLSFLIRVIVRLKAFHKLFADDPLVLFSCVLLLTNAIIWQVVKEDLYLNLAVSAGQLYPPPADFPTRTERYLRASVAIIIFFYTGLWAIKISLLVFFKKLGQNVRNQTIIWWSVLAVTCASYFVCLGTIEYKCLAGSFMYIECGFHSPIAWLSKFHLGLIHVSSLYSTGICGISEEFPALEHDLGCRHGRTQLVSSTVWK